MTPKQRKKLLKHKKSSQLPEKNPAQSSYIQKLISYRQLFSDYPSVKLLINNIVEADRLLNAGLLPQSLPELLLPDDIQDQIFTKIGQQYPAGDKRGDTLWNQLSAALPDLDKQIRSFRDYLEEHYGMWAYISASFMRDLADFVENRTVLELMAGNGYISKGLRDAQKTVYTTDNKAWVAENETGKHPVTAVEKLDALAAIDKYPVDVVIMSWSPDKLDIDWQVLQKLRTLNPQPAFIVIGEKNGATGSKTFWEQADYINDDVTQKLNKNYTHFDLIHDQVYRVE